MLKIRLKKIGRKKYATYRIVIMDSKTRRNGKPISDLGFYNPYSKEVNIKKNSFIQWIKKGARPNQSVINIINSN